jgi:hypothetical protein
VTTPVPLTGHRLGDVIGHTRAADWPADSVAGALDPPDAGGDDAGRSTAVGMTDCHSVIFDGSANGCGVRPSDGAGRDACD